MTKQIKIEQRKPEQLTGYANNSRVHDENQIHQIAESINEFGFTNPLLIDEANMVIAGHGRLEAARRLGLEKIPVIILRGLSDDQKRAYILADNKLALNARWDETLLAAELSELQLQNFDMELTGFNEMEIATRIDESVDDHRDEWRGMPEFEQNSAEAYRTLILHVATEEDWAEVVKMLGLVNLTDKTKFAYFPPDVERDLTSDLRVVDSEQAN